MVDGKADTTLPASEWHTEEAGVQGPAQSSGIGTDCIAGITVRAIAFDHRQHGVCLAAAELIWTLRVYFKRCVSRRASRTSGSNDCEVAGPVVWQILRR